MPSRAWILQGLQCNTACPCPQRNPCTAYNHVVYSSCPSCTVIPPWLQLKYRHGVLTRALELRDYTLRVMSSKSGTCPAPPSWAMALPRSASGVPPAAGCTAPGRGQDQHGSSTSAGVCPVAAPAPAPADTLAEAVWVPGSVGLLLSVQPPVDQER